MASALRAAATHRLTIKGLAPEESSRSSPPKTSTLPSAVRNFTPRPAISNSNPHSTLAASTAVAAPTPVVPTVEDRRRGTRDVSGKSRCNITEVDSAVQLEFNPAPVVSVVDVAPGIRCITVEAEISREFIPLDKAYTKPGQSVLVRRSEKSAAKPVPVSSPPFTGETNFGVLYKMRGDITAGASKAPQYALSVRTNLDLHVTEASESDLFDLQPGGEVELGQFLQNGMDLRPIMFLSRFPTLLIFAQGPSSGIASARALIEADDVGSLYPTLRREVRLYYSAPSPAQLAYKEFFETWESLNVKVRPVVQTTAPGWGGFVGSVSSAFDEDDLEYDPETTGAVVCGDKKFNDEALRVLEDAGIPRASIVVWTQ